MFLRIFDSATTAQTAGAAQWPVDKKLNARCLYMLAKCELNDYYNKGSENTYSVKLDYRYLTLPESESFKELKEKYANTSFHEMIIQECSYFRHYSALH